MNSTTILAFCILGVFYISSTQAVPVAIYEVPVAAVSDTAPLTLLDIEQSNESAIDGESERLARGLGLGGKFGGFGGLGHGSFKGFGGLGGLGFGGLHGLGGGFGGLGFKNLFGKHFG
ncbi:keratin, type I cytoskeletal 9-like [Teleopsis dalmanni]|uniref:keratin, type I cytoskeletal 9-like n=1 Tax=Teleopsis dalmanni TaxID=139649 RepID=UPI0018CEFA27|nr:keratin, type I cytoskeletal 9-like [Teleopsis dalmanni]XP_037941157.1 keratin, type I cytoskeletal 9-like [Teleopsis dalmanni]